MQLGKSNALYSVILQRRYEKKTWFPKTFCMSHIKINRSVNIIVYALVNTSEQPMEYRYEITNTIISKSHNKLMN